VPALPLGEAGRYVAAAYIVFLVLIVVYVAIMAAKLQRIERELRELAGFAETRQNPVPTGRPAAGVRGIDPTQPQTGPDPNLAPPEAVGGPGAATRGAPDV
jgi:hypothetical protein